MATATSRVRRRELIAVAMSGGVDSSLAASLLVSAGHDVVGFFLANEAGGGAEQPGACAVAAARAAAERLGIPLRVLDATSSFERIIERFVGAYQIGRTPNPCVECNAEVKFGLLLDVARSLGAARLATGHYARMEVENGRHVLCRGADRRKDQSYVLSGLRQEQLAHALFPLGERTKDEVRRLARAASLPAHDRPESQEICFVPSGDYRDLLAARAPDARRPGDIVTLEGAAVGRHAGVAGFTVGQRRGLGVALGERCHVVRIDAAARRVVIGSRAEACSARLAAGSANWILEAEPTTREERRVTAQIRYRHGGAAACARWLAPGRFEVRFDAPEFAVTPGQTVVLYVGDRVLAAGAIECLDEPRREVERC
ncbi:MAG: tRNA 2-thiouridine(34) synthase MnmA [Planctomycetes bacterium]|nr:tRNA 2-thiouridine(34) synthase MnmA [Planctomycetota bacterium]